MKRHARKVKYLCVIFIAKTVLECVTALYVGSGQTYQNCVDHSGWNVFFIDDDFLQQQYVHLMKCISFCFSHHLVQESAISMDNVLCQKLNN